MLKKGFTLAEVLITLTLIGVLSALTIPTVINNVNNTANVVKLKKINADLQQAFMLLQAENGGSILPVIATETSDTTGGANVMSAFLTKLNYVKNCGNAKGCWYDTPLYFLDGSTVNLGGYDTAWNNKNGKAILANGTMMLIGMSSLNCTDSKGAGSLNFTCGYLRVDLNGANGPNRVGRDYFNFYITQTGIIPDGAFDRYGGNYNDCYPNFHGWSCTARIISEGAMNY